MSIAGPNYNWMPLRVDPEVNEAFRQIADALTYIQENSTSGGTPSLSLDQLTDVVVPSPANNDYLRFVGGDWINQPGAAGAVNVLDDLGDVVLTGPIDKEQKLKYNGVDWINVGPVNLAFTYNGAGQLEGVDGVGVNIDFAYNLDGTLNTVNNQTKVLTFGYTSGQLTSITVA